MACLKTNQNNAAACQDLAKAYLNCRMDRCAIFLLTVYLDGMPDMSDQQESACTGILWQGRTWLSLGSKMRKRRMSSRAKRSQQRASGRRASLLECDNNSHYSWHPVSSGLLNAKDKHTASIAAVSFCNTTLAMPGHAQVRKNADQHWLL